MKTIPSLEAERTRLFSEIGQWVEGVRAAASVAPSCIADGVAILASIRKNYYEDLNQLLHQALIIDAALHLSDALSVPGHAVWSWNPKQTGTALEPDLRADADGTCFLSAEITTSPRAVGSLYKRMSTTLSNMSEMDGAKFYVVSSDEIAKTARGFILARALPIEVLVLARRRNVNVLPNPLPNSPTAPV